VFAGAPGIGKDTQIAPLVAAVGRFNFNEIGPAELLANFNPWAQSLLLRVNEVQDHGHELNRFSFYEASKVILASPPDVLTVNQKYLPAYPVFNVVNVVMTTNHAIDGLFLPADDRRYFVAASNATKDDLGGQPYFDALWAFLESGGCGHVAAYLRGLDIAQFNPKAPPPRTAAFWRIVQSAGDPVESELVDAIEKLGNPDALTLDDLRRKAGNATDLAITLNDAKQRRKLPAMMGRAGYGSIANPDSKQGLWRVAGVKTMVYARSSLSRAQQFTAVRALSREPEGRPWER
jgi:hypothetical protein